MTQGIELNLDGIVGPTHHYGGLSFGNTASMKHSQNSSNPKLAALEGLEKMYTLNKLGVVQGVIPPQERPLIPVLRSIGFKGSDSEIIKSASSQNPDLFYACCSSSSMWAANAATVSPSADSDGKVHLTPANLVHSFHRSIEAFATGLFLSRIFPDREKFTHHSPLPSHSYFADEGAANHTRFCKNYNEPGIQLFVYGRSIQDKTFTAPQLYPARQTKEASEAIARLHHLSPEKVLFAKQNPEAIDAGVFHNDVISVGNKNVFFCHEKAFTSTALLINELTNCFEKHCQSSFIPIIVKSNDISIEEAVKTYLFNSQLISLSDGSMLLIAPQECFESGVVRPYLDALIKNHSQPIRQVIYQNVRGSMQNGGGPACLRLRVALNTDELAATNPSIFLTEDLYKSLRNWVIKHYRDHLTISDLDDPELLKENYAALDELTQILKLGSLYSFQQGI